MASERGGCSPPGRASGGNTFHVVMPGGAARATVGPLSLQQLVVNKLISVKQHLYDVGDVPLELLAPVLRACKPEKLAEIEDATRAGGRDLSVGTWCLWQAWVMERLNANWPADKRLSPTKVKCTH